MMDEELKRIEIENSDLHVAINILKEWENLFVPTAEDAEVLLKDAKKNAEFYQLNNFTIENHEELLTQEEINQYINDDLWQIPHEPDYFDSFTVYEIKSRALVLINSKIKKYTKEYLTNKTFLNKDEETATFNTLPKPMRKLKQISAKEYEVLLNNKKIDISVKETKMNKAISIIVIPCVELKYSITETNKGTISDYFRKNLITAKKIKNKFVVTTHKS